MFRMDDNTPGLEPATDLAPVHPAKTLSLELFSPGEIARLISARDHFLNGDLNESPGDYKRIRFARWLYQHGKISD